MPNLASHSSQSTMITHSPLEHNQSYQIVHATPGRIRVSIPELSHDQEFASRLEWILKSTTDILEVRLNPIINCLVVNYSSDTVSFAEIKIVLANAINHAKEQDLLVPVFNQIESSTEKEIYYLQRLGLPLFSLFAAVTVTSLEIPATLFVSGLILVAAIPLFTSTIKKTLEERQINAEVLESLWTILHTWEGTIVAPALALSMEGLWKVLRNSVTTVVDYEEIHLQLAGVFTHVKREGREEKVLIEQVEIGEQVVIYPGEMIPVDGSILQGKATVDEETLTGICDVVLRREGDKVYASNLLVDGKLVVLVERTGKDTQIGKLVSFINKAPAHETKIADVAEEVGNMTIMPILTLSSIVFALTGDIHRSLSLLQLDFTTGIRISSATAVLTAINYATEKCGVYIRSGHALEVLGRLDTIVFDKTGTLTHIHAEVIDIQTMDETISTLEILRLAAAMEKGLSHPSAKAIVGLAESKGVLAHIEWEDWEYKIGRGVISQLHGKKMLLGSKKFLRKHGMNLKHVYQKYPDLRRSGHTHVYLTCEDQILGVFSLDNPIREESASVISALAEQQIDSYMLTGDHAKAANAVARSVGIPPSRIYVEALCEQKVEVLQKLDKQGKTVAYVGEGMNDAVGLAYADVSISLAEGSQIARESADIILVNNSLEGIVMAITIARKVKEIIEQNIALVAIPNISIVLAGVLLGLDPVLAVFMNSSATILAEINGLRPLTGILEDDAVSKTVRQRR